MNIMINEFISVIKQMMHMRYRIFVTIKLLISRHVFLHGGGSRRPSSLFLYLCLFVNVDNMKLLFICSFVRKS